MIASADFNRLSPNERADLIYAQAHSDVATRLWRAALGNGSSDAIDGGSAGAENPSFNLDSLLTMIAGKGDAKAMTAVGTAMGANMPTAWDFGTATPVPPSSVAGFKASMPDPVAGPASGLASGTLPGPLTSLATGLGPNARFGAALQSAAVRSGIPAAALAAIVDAEAAKTGDGSWKTTSRNPRSSAAGLGQFLGGTWQSEAERVGTWLHGTAVSAGWLGGDGHVLAGAKSALLALRYDATASINATADYASRSVAQLKRAGIAVGEDLTTVARAAYLGHHLGPADAVRFLKGGLDSGRARFLLDAQVGRSAASQRIESTGDAASAHRSWLLDVLNRRVTPWRFAL